MSKRNRNETASTVAETAPLPTMTVERVPVEGAVSNEAIAEMLDRHMAAFEEHPVSAPPVLEEPQPPVDHGAVIIGGLISDIRSMFSHNEPTHMEVVRDLRDPEGRGVLGDEARHRSLAKAVAMRADFHDQNVDPGAPASDETVQLAINSYRDHLYALCASRKP